MLLLLTSCQPAPASGDDTGVPIPPDTAAAGLYAEPALDGALQPLLLDAISGATRRIDVAQYTLYDSGSVTPLIDALVAAAGRGVAVRVLADEAASGTPDALERLAAGGVQTALDSPTVTTHTKLVIADSYTFVGSHNWSSSAMSRNHEGSAMLWAEDVTAHYAAFFEALWAEPAADPGLTWSGDGPLTPLLNREVHPGLLACMEEAQAQIRVVMYAIADNPDYPDSEVAALVEALITAHERGVDVGVLVDGSDWIVDNTINDHAIERLRSGGVPVWRTPSSDTTHAKVLLCDETAIISDANWSYSALTGYHGASLQIDDADIAEQLAVWWLQLTADSEQLP